ncbi:MAG: MFS transporter, partial [Anaerolineae bacterium]
MTSWTSRLLDPSSAGSVNRVHVLMVNSMAMWMCAFMASAVNVALPSIQTEFGLGAVALGWIPLTYMLASAAFLVPFGKIADMYGRRLVYLAGLVLFLVSAFALAFVPSYIPLVILRITQGIGASMMFASSMAMVTLAYPPGQRGRAMGVLVATVYVGQVMGPVVGGVLTHNLGWRSLFAFGAAYGLVNLVLDLVLLRRAEWKEAPARYDWVGSAAYAVSLSAFLVGLSWLPEIAAIVLLVGGLVGLLAFGWWENRFPVPVLDLSLFRDNRVFALSNLAALASYAAIAAMTMLMSLYLQFIRGLDPQTAGLLLVAGVVFQAAFSPTAGRLSDRVEPRWVASTGMVLCTLGLLSFSFLSSSTAYWRIILALIVLGLGYAFFSSPNQNSIMSSVDRSRVTTASATLGTARQVGQALSVATATLVMALIVGRHDIRPADYPNLLLAIRVAFGILTFVCALGLAA